MPLGCRCKEETINDDYILWKSEEQLEDLFENPIYFCKSK